MKVPVIRADALELPGIRHAFFTRNGGVSQGIYASFNGGTGSNDNPGDVAENRARMARSIGVASEALLVPYQIHSAECLVVSQPWREDERPRCDGLVTNVPGIGLGITGADCGMILFADPQARVIGACHAGWKGALTGILESTLDAMATLGATRQNTHAVLGPTIAQPSYEVGPEFVARFTEADAGNSRYFLPSQREGHSLFDLPGYIALRLVGAGVGSFENLGLDTYALEDQLFSYRRSTHRSEPDYGRLVSAIALA